MILVFEDNCDLAFLMRKIISVAVGLPCVVCQKEDDAETEVFSGNVDLIVSDISIDGKSQGISFIRKIRKIMPFSCPPIVVYTGISPQSEDFQEAENISDALYEKGETSIIELCAKVKKLILRRR
jgi:DNA-binding response OmpR family regulator